MSNFSITKAILVRIPLTWIRCLLVVLGAILFLPFLGSVHLFDWDEINFAESAREMLVTSDYSLVQINFQPFWEKPPLFIWMQVLSMKLFGVNEFAARFPNAICGMATILVLFEVGRRFKGKLFGLIWVMAYICSALPFIYFKSGIIDPWFNLYMFISICFFFYATQENNPTKKSVQIIASAMGIGFAVLTKGPVAFLLMGISVFIYLTLSKKWKIFGLLHGLLFFVVALVVGGSYHLYLWWQGHEKILQDFIDYQLRLAQTEDAGHGGFLFYHVVVLLLGVFPSSVFALYSFWKKEQDKDVRQFKKMMIILFVVVLLIFTIVKTKILHYSSMCYFPLSFLAALYLYELMDNKAKLKWGLSILLMMILVLYMVAPSMIQLFFTRADILFDKHSLPDPFIWECLKSKQVFQGQEWMLGFILVVVMLVWFFVRSYTKKILVLFLGFMLFVYTFIYVFLNKIENYSQAPLIAYMQRFAGEDVYVASIGFKSYAPYFYAERKDFPFPSHKSEVDILLADEVEKPVYFVCKTHTLSDILNSFPQLQLIEKNGGYALLKKINQTTIDDKP